MVNPHEPSSPPPDEALSEMSTSLSEEDEEMATISDGGTLKDVPKGYISSSTSEEDNPDEDDETEQDEEEEKKRWKRLLLLLLLLLGTTAVVGLFVLVDWEDPPSPTVPLPNTTELWRAVSLYHAQLEPDPSLQTSLEWEKVQVLYGRDMRAWDVSFIEDFSRTFDVDRVPAATDFNLDISKWNVSAGRDFTAMFRGARSFDADVRFWNVSQGVHFTSMYEDAASFNQDIRMWNMENAEYMSFMFAGATQFDQNLARWRLPSVKNMSFAFAEATLFSQDLCRWGVSLPVAVDTTGAFAGTKCPEAEIPTNTRIVPPGPFCFDCGRLPQDPTHAPVAAPPSPYKCFDNEIELATAVDDYMLEPSGALTAETYGHPIGKWCTSRITSFRQIFSTSRNAAMATFNEDIGEWDVSSARSISYMFQNANRFDQDISKFDVSQVTDFTGTFEGCRSFNKDVREWQVSNAISMINMFKNATSFDQDLSRWDVAKVSSFRGTFQGASGFSGGGISGWNVSSATDTSLMFDAATSFSEDLSRWPTFRVTTTMGMFREAVSFNSPLFEDVRQVRNAAFMFAYLPFFNQDVSFWDLSRANNVSGMFFGSAPFRQNLCSWGDNLHPDADVSNMFEGTKCAYQEEPTLDIPLPGPFCFLCSDPESTVAPSEDFENNPFPDNPDPVAPIDHTPECFKDGRELREAVDGYLISPDLPGPRYGYTIGKWCVGNVTGFEYVWSNVRNPAAALFNEPLDGWDMSAAITTYGMFNGARAFNQDLSMWDVGGVVDFGSMFNNCTNFDGDIAGWNTSSASSMVFMFGDAESFDQDISGWSTSNVQDFTGMFQRAYSFDQDIGNWDVSSATNMNSMFFRAGNFSANLSGWNVSSVTDMGGMLAGTQVSADLSGWDVSRVASMTAMFAMCDSFNADLSSWDVSSVDRIDLMFFGATSFNQDLCAWGDLLPSTVDVTDAFAYTDCVSHDSPAWAANAAGPFCAVC